MHLYRLFHDFYIRMKKRSKIIPLNFGPDKSDQSLFVDTHLKSRSIRSSSLEDSAIEILSLWELYLTVPISASLLFWSYSSCYLQEIHVKVIHQWFRDRETISKNFPGDKLWKKVKRWLSESVIMVIISTHKVCDKPVTRSSKIIIRISSNSTLLKYYCKHTLNGAEIERNNVESNSIFIITMW